jgi:hypothetical protein
MLGLSQPPSIDTEHSHLVSTTGHNTWKQGMATDIIH